MRRILPLFCLAMLSAALLAGCAAGQKYPTDNAYHPETDAQYSMQFGGQYRYFAEAENGCYMILGNILYYLDSGAMEPVPVCPRPDCLHEDESCSAFFDLRQGAIFFADGKLYVLYSADRHYVLAEVSPESGTRKTCVELDADIVQNRTVVHRGRFYAASGAYREDGAAATAVLSWDLSRPGKAPEQIAEIPPLEKEGGSVPVSELTAHGHYLYFYQQDRMGRIDLNASKKGIEFLFEDVADKGFLTFCGDSALFTTAKWLDRGEYRNDVWVSQELRTAETLLTGLYGGASAADERWLYHLDDMRREDTALPDDPLYGKSLKVYDLSGELIDSISVSEMSESHMYMFYIAREYIFLASADSHVWYIDKADIGTGHAQLHILTDFGYLE